ncbi:MAG: type II toxin-antitoxin system PemK/MazF family toxin [Chromatiales bacterium]|nr:type II toxin-antitoxin system PemK/MazF family toxin [Gammaproteobacteria bacterium]MBW6476465.1 type II toxin-antitoxin system PemK/MazF family toxin [Chromatiales bacterium]
MKQAGDVALTPFPYTDLSGAKLRPVLLLQEAPGGNDDWLVCMISTQLHQAVAGFDELLQAEDDDYVSSGLKSPSVLRLSRLALLHGSLMPGAIGRIGMSRLHRVRCRIAEWVSGGGHS